MQGQVQGGFRSSEEGGLLRLRFNRAAGILRAESRRSAQLDVGGHRLRRWRAHNQSGKRVEGMGAVLVAAYPSLFSEMAGTAPEARAPRCSGWRGSSTWRS